MEGKNNSFTGKITMSEIKFSIVITTYNRVEFLQRAIDTALNQTIPCQVVVVDDCSQDNTENYVKNLIEKLQKQNDYRLIYHKNIDNLGHAKSMNKGVELAEGNWIKPMDDDDYLALNCIEKMSELIAVHSQAVICCCQAVQVDKNEQQLSITRKYGREEVFYIAQEDIHYGMLFDSIPFGTTIQIAFTKAAFIKSGGWDSQFDANFDDSDSWVKISQFGDAIFINECLAYRTVWLGAYNWKFPIETRLQTNIIIKEKIYPLINQKYQDNLPKLTDIKHYTQLHWSLVAIKQLSLWTAIKIMFPVIFLPIAWKLIVRRSKWANFFGNPINYSENKYKFSMGNSPTAWY
jgi:glycosyltransferase involved in cell wall biosynthesis